jgi:CheY-like chemotaxis protein
MLTAHILLVEDEEITAALTESVLRDQVDQVSIAADGESAWKMLKSGTTFDAVLLDRGLPDIDGMVLLQRIKADPELSWIPVIMATSRDDSESMRETFAAGADYYLTKPLQAPYLLAVPRLAIKAGREFREVESALAALNLALEAAVAAITLYPPPIEPANEAPGTAELAGPALSAPEQLALTKPPSHDAINLEVKS